LAKTKEWREDRVATFRMVQIHQLLVADRCPSCMELAQRFEVSKRTVQRDIESMQDLMAAPIVYDRRRKGYIYTERFSFPLPRLTEGEVCALFLLDKILGQLEGTPYADALASVGTKLRALMAQEAYLPPGKEAEVVSVANAALRGDEVTLARNFAMLQKACVDQSTVEMKYYSATSNRVRIRCVDPYHLHYHQGAWYLIGYCHLRKKGLTFALDRIRDLKVTNEEFQKPESFNHEDYLGESWGIVRGETFLLELVFDAHQARWIKEKTWHEGQELSELPDGRLSFCAPAAGVEEVKQWVLGFGSHVEVVGPEWLREEVREEVGKMREMYGE
jgi:predicted DNA-binding transcriptional regulator YafY